MTQAAHLSLIKAAIAAGHSMQVCDGEYDDNNEMVLYPVHGYQEAKDAVEGVDESRIEFTNKDGVYLGHAYIVLGNDPDELVADYSVPRDPKPDDPRNFVDNWMNQYIKECG